MSFLNPVNEPVLRFSSTDAGAPQINYNARTAGDVKAVLKACLVTGYGAKASAGWTAVNETATVIEFVSPSVAMSDYRLGIDDTSTASTTWYYQHQDARVNPVGNVRRRAIPYITPTHANNGWELLVTERGIYFIHVLQSSFASAKVAQVIFWGQIKSALVSNNDRNIGFFAAGHDTGAYPMDFFSAAALGVNNRHYDLGGTTALEFGAINLPAITAKIKIYSTNIAIQSLSPVFLVNQSQVVGQQSGFLLRDISLESDALGVYEGVLDARPALYVCLGSAWSGLAGMMQTVRHIILYLDYWEY